MTDDPPGQPEHGGRLQAKLLIADGESVTYALSVSDAHGSVLGRASIGEATGEVRFEAWQGEGEGEPPAWLVAGMRALLRSAWQRRRSGEAWPRRLTRWRPAPEAGA